MKKLYDDRIPFRVDSLDSYVKLMRVTKQRVFPVRQIWENGRGCYSVQVEADNGQLITFIDMCYNHHSWFPCLVESFCREVRDGELSLSELKIKVTDERCDFCMR